MESLDNTTEIEIIKDMQLSKDIWEDFLNLPRTVQLYIICFFFSNEYKNRGENNFKRIYEQLKAEMKAE